MLTEYLSLPLPLIKFLLDQLPKSIATKMILTVVLALVLLPMPFNLVVELILFLHGSTEDLFLIVFLTFFSEPITTLAQVPDKINSQLKPDGTFLPST